MCVPCQHFGQRFRSRTLIHEPLRSGRSIVRIVRIRLFSAGRLFSAKFAKSSLFAFPWGKEHVPLA